MQTEVNIAILAHTHRVLFVPSHTLSHHACVSRIAARAADQEIKPSGVDAMRNTLVVVRRVVRRSAVLAVVIIHLLYVKPLYRQWFKDLFALWDRHHFTVLLVLLLL